MEVSNDTLRRDRVRRGNKVLDNLGLVAWLVRQKTRKGLAYIIPLPDALKFGFEDGQEVVESHERIEKTLDEWLDLVREVYNKPDIKYVKFDKDMVKIEEEITNIRKFEENLKDKLTTKIEYECILHRIPYSGLEKLYSCRIPDILDIYRDLDVCIKNYCPRGKPTMPISLDIYLNGRGNILSKVSIL
jgi:hypothetical protein